MPEHFSTPWPQRLVPLTLGLLIFAGGALLLGLVMELGGPVWSRPAIGLLVLAVGCACAALGARWARSRRFIIYPLVLAATIYLWDTTLPPPSLPEGQLRAALPRLALLGILADGLLLLQRRGWRPRSLPRPAVRVPVRRGLLPLEEVALLFQISAAELRDRLAEAGAAPVWSAGEEAIRLVDLLQVLGQWNRYGHQNDPRSRRPPAPNPAPSGPDLNSLTPALGALWFALSAVVALAPGAELRLLVDGQGTSAIATCLLPWSVWVVGTAAALQLLSLGIAVWVLPRLRQRIWVMVAGGLLSGLGLGLMAGDPCAW